MSSFRQAAVNCFSVSPDFLPLLGVATLAAVAMAGLFACPPAFARPLVGQEPSPGPSPAQPSSQATHPFPPEEGWLSLFDGSSLRGWTVRGEADWRVEEGEIRVGSGEPGLLCSTSQWSDFELSLDFFIGPETNSGVFLRTSPVPRDPATDCYEVNLIHAGRHEFSTGAIVGRSRSAIGPAADTPGWHRLEVFAEGGRIRTVVDGVLAAELDDERPLGRGFIGLQFNGGPAAFRNIWLRPVGLRPLLPDSDRSGAPDSEPVPVELMPEGMWLTDGLGAGKARWIPAGQRLLLEGGPGQLESREQWDDFVLQTAVRTEAAGTNSGIFFRCQPGSAMNGYEIQIDHTPSGEVAEAPANGGTGAIFRQTSLERLMSRDGEWFQLTAAVCGPHVSVWIDGRLATDWNDRRNPDPNPRRGRRLEAGTIMLQAHDPATAVSFSKFRIAALRPRHPD